MEACSSTLFVHKGIDSMHKGIRRYCTCLDLLLHHVVIDECWHECDGEGARTLSEDLCNGLVFQPNHVLAIDFSQVVVNQNTIPTQTQCNEIHD